MAGATSRRERKVVTVVFCDLVGFTSRAESMDPEDVEALLGPYHARVRSELERRGGTVEKFIGDAVMALFGAPTAHEDDPERAVRAALAIRGFALDEELELRIGITTGEALISLDARPDAGEGMASGDVVNTAARLQSAAPVNGVVVDKTTHRATRHAIDYREGEPVDAKGKVEPIAVWEALEARARFGPEVLDHVAGDLVGRDQRPPRRFACRGESIPPRGSRRRKGLLDGRPRQRKRRLGDGRARTGAKGLPATPTALVGSRRARARIRARTRA